MLFFFLLQLILGVDMIFYFFHFVFPPPEENKQVPILIHVRKYT